MNFTIEQSNIMDGGKRFIAMIQLGQQQII